MAVESTGLNSLSPRERAASLGFSLIELIVVICIVALVIAAGLPRFTDTLKQTHETAVVLSARALQNAVLNAKAIQMLNGVSGYTYNLSRFGDNTLDLSAEGFPAGTTRKPGDRLSARNCEEIWNALFESSLDESNPEKAQHSDNGVSNFRTLLDTSGKAAVCSYIYRHGGAMSIRYDPASGKVWADAKFKGSVFSN